MAGRASRTAGIVAGFALVTGGAATPPSFSAAAAPEADPHPSMVGQMRDTASGALTLRHNPATGKIAFARVTGSHRDLLPGVAAEDRRSAVDKATRYLTQYASAFGARPAELEQSEVYADRGGWSVTFRQSYQGVPVFGAELKAEVDPEGALTSVNGFVAPDLALTTAPRLTRADADARALAMVRADPDGYQTGTAPRGYRHGLRIRSDNLMIYRTGSPRGISGESRLAWVAEVWNRTTIRETVILDAATGKPLNRWTMITDALDRHLVEGHDNGTTGDLSDDYYTAVYDEGDALPGSLTGDQSNEVLGTGETYWMFRNTFGYNSWDGAGGPMVTINNDPRISCPNANWNGVTTNFCTGVSSDDVVGHEWSHAYTESTSGLIYQWQAGAINEAYSDIWGQTLDMMNHRDNQPGETPGDLVRRTGGGCSEFTRHEVTMAITAPASVAGPCTAAEAMFGPVITQSGVDATAVVGVDTDSDGSSTTDGCSSFDNAGDLVGQWVYVDRGTCTFAIKGNHAEDAGAVGIIVGDDVSGRPPIHMGGCGCNLPHLFGVMVTLEDGARFKSAGGPVSFHVAAVPAATDGTTRWLVDESDRAYGAAIRDMWNPSCLGSPGKVSDAEYQCSEDDHGGVHTNSGVVNRTYAILVDGLPGKVGAIGIDKAAWLFWYTQTHFLTPESSFPDLADGLEASCAALQGIALDKVTVGDPTRPDGADGATQPGVVVGGTTVADCNRVRAAIKETQLRLDPTDECDYRPVLQPGAGPRIDCGADTRSRVTYREDFEDGLEGWTQDEELTYPAGHGYDWTASSSAPQHPGVVAFGATPLEGDCAGGADDISSRNGLISSAITVPNGRSPRLSFQHYVATEAGFDGANVKVSVDGGAFEQVPADAYLFNAPATTLEPAAAGDTDPMAGEEAWTGTDGGTSHGSWGTSIIDLSAIAGAGDTVTFRFDIGRDGCGGVEGWYVDDVVVTSCVHRAVATRSTAAAPRSVERGRAFSVRVEVKANGATPTGRVVLTQGELRLGRGVLDGRGVATIVVRRVFALGSHTLTATYRGRNAGFRPSSADVTVRVVRR